MFIKSGLLASIFLLFAPFTFGQVKIGEEVSNIHSASILELESTSQVLVLTRVSNAQMLQIKPLQGAIVFNTDTGCIHFYNDSGWRSLCEGSTDNFYFADNNDGTFTINYANGSVFTSSDLTGPKGEKGDTGPQGPPGVDGTNNEIKQEQVIIIASNGQTRFITPAPIMDDKKIEVYRNGIRVGFITVDPNTIELESGVTCFQNDKIRIVQILNP